MPAEEQVTIVILGRDAASKAFGSVSQNAQKAGKQIEKGFADKLKAAGKAAGDLGKKMSIGVTAPLALFGGMAVNSAIKAERLTKTLHSLAGGADEAAQYIEAIQDASLGTIPKVEALAIANRALSFGVVDTTKGMKELTQIAITLGRAQGLDASRAVADLTTSLARQSPMILDNLGITLRLSEATKIAAEHAHEFGKSADELTKAQEFQIAALVKGREAMERMGGMQDDMAASGERVKAQMSDLATEIGAMLIPVMQMGLDIVGPLVQGFINLDDGTKKLIVTMVAVAAAAGPAMVKFQLLANVASSLIGTLPAVVAGLKNAGAAFSLIGQGQNIFGVLTTAVSGSALALGGVGVALGAAAVVAKVFHDQTKITNQALDEFKAGLEETDQALAQLLQEEEGVTAAADHMADKMHEVYEIFNRDPPKFWEDIAVSLDRSAREADAQRDAAKELHAELVAGASTYEEYIAVMQEYNKWAQENTRLEKEMVVTTDGSTDLRKTQVEWVEKAAGAMDGYTEAQWRGIKVAQRMAEMVPQEAEMLYQLGERSRETAYNLDVSAESMQAFLDSMADDQNIQVMATGMRILSQETEEATATQKAAAEEQAAAAERNAARLEEYYQKQAVAAEESARRQKAAAEEAARGQAGLISAMQDATQEMFNQQVLAAVDPAEVGVDVWAQLGQELGLLDETQVNMADAATKLIDAYRDGVVPTENMAEATQALYEEAQKAAPEFGTILDHFAKAPGLIGPSKDELEKHFTELEKNVELLPEGSRGLDDFATSAGDAQTPVSELAAEIDELNLMLAEVEGTHYVDVVTNYRSTGTPPSGTGGDGVTGSRQMGGPIYRTGLYQLHAGEVVLNPYRAGAMGGPGGPPPPPSVTRNYGGDTYNVTINDRLAMALFMEQQRDKRFKRLNARM
jgi:hypothetical protein